MAMRGVIVVHVIAERSIYSHMDWELPINLAADNQSTHLKQLSMMIENQRLTT